MLECIYIYSSKISFLCLFLSTYTIKMNELLKKKKFDISAFYWKTYKEFDKFAISKIQELNEKHGYNLNYARKKDHVAIYNNMYVHAFFTSIEFMAWIAWVNFRK